MSSETSLKLYKITELGDSREFEVGQIWYIKDELIAIPTIDRTDVTREIHEGRRVVITHNSRLNCDPTWPLVYVAPLSHRVDLMRETDIEITTSRCDGNGVSTNCILQLALVQPVLKKDLERKTGSLSRAKITDMLSLQEDNLLGKLEPLSD